MLLIVNLTSFNDGKRDSGKIYNSLQNIFISSVLKISRFSSKTKNANQMHTYNKFYTLNYRSCWVADREILIHDGEAGVNKYSHLPDDIFVKQP